jgi:hypothetical protein
MSSAPDAEQDTVLRITITTRRVVAKSENRLKTGWNVPIKSNVLIAKVNTWPMIRSVSTRDMRTIAPGMIGER